MWQISSGKSKSIAMHSDHWCHIKCEDLPVEVFNQITLKTNEPWNCLLCKINSNK